MKYFKSNEEKIKFILKSIEAGKDLDSIAKEVGYKNAKSLDMFMRREGYIKEKRLGNYYPKNGRGIILDDEFSEEANIPTKVLEIIRLFRENQLSPKRIANETGFETPKELALYMKSKGFIWDSNRNNYIPEKKGIEEFQENVDESVNEVFEQVTQPMNVDFNKYLELLEYLYSKKEKIFKLLEFEDCNATIPRYILPGVFLTKSVHMSSRLDQMVRDYSEDKNISQREIFEIALIDFFKKYGYAKEVQIMLDSVD